VTESDSSTIGNFRRCSISSRRRVRNPLPRRPPASPSPAPDHGRRVAEKVLHAHRKDTLCRGLNVGYGSVGLVSLVCTRLARAARQRTDRDRSCWTRPFRVRASAKTARGRLRYRYALRQNSCIPTWQLCHSGIFYRSCLNPRSGNSKAPSEISRSRICFSNVSLLDTNSKQR
jgi:hypothetical protein